MNPAEQQNEYSDQNKRADALFDGVCAPGVFAQEEFVPDVDLQQLVKRASTKANKNVLISILRLVYRSFEQQGSILSLAVFCAPHVPGESCESGKG